MHPPSVFARALEFASDIRPAEIRPTLSAFVLAFILMSAYYMLRPVRDAMASDWSDTEVSFLWTLTFFVSVAVVMLYGKLITLIRFRHLVPAVYAIFVLSFAWFFLGTRLLAEHRLLDQAFYVWVSVFSLFHVSVFWSLMATRFTRVQATRLFGFIGAGASVGAMVGPAIPTFLVADIGTYNLLPIASLLLLLAVPLSYWLQTEEVQADAETRVDLQDECIGGNPFAGFSEFFKSPYLLAIGLFILLYTSISTFVYFELKNLLAVFDRATRTQLWASMDLIVNTLTLVVAAFATGRIASRFGLSLTLAAVPAMIGAGLLLLAIAPLVGVVVVIQIIRRAGNYAITRPAREMLFTAVDRETRFKAKPVVDIVIYRGGDMLNAWAFTALTQGLGLGLDRVAGIGAMIAVLWATLGIYLGKAFKRRASC